MMINKTSNSTDASDEEPGKLFVGGLSWETTEEKLQQYFGEFGEVIDSVVMKNTESGQSRGFGFVTFGDPNSVEKVLAKGTHLLDGRAIDPKPCSTKAAIKSKKNSQYPKIFLGGLPFNVTETDLRSIFSKYGEVMDVIIMYDHEKNKCRGFGFLSFEKDEDVNKCVADHYIYVNGKKVEVKRAEPRDGRGSASAATQWPNAQTTPAVDPSRNMPMQNYQGWGAAPAPGYGYGAPPGAPVPYGGWGGPPPTPQWGPGYPTPGYTPYDPYGRAAMPPAPPPPAPQTASKQEYSSYASYSGYTPDPAAAYSAPGTTAAPRTTYGIETTAAAPGEPYGSAPGPQRNNQSQQSYHPYRRV
ncbi:heterogeneous nuclear ribonucleoprotein 27C-like isoform X4 [Planococcus citri]|uniref:heterogeneous nuclear ribonucleoprotein 27C-like isoform X4 n=1 Tax=Planococcus citri TaxID=170843 RepID=UPI0031F77FA3